MAQVIWTEPALENIEEIAEHIAISNYTAASNLVQHVFKAVDRLEDFPLSGKVPEEISELQYREVVVNPVRVFYKVSGEAVFILHVIRQERDVRKYILSKSIIRHEVK